MITTNATRTDSTACTWPRQFELSTKTEDLKRVRLMYAMLCCLQLPAMLTETPELSVVRCNCTWAQWEEAVAHIDWIGMQCNLRIGV